ncbi:hypothetical protein DL93DRAFT_2087946 [Clavulina sp. PMI_390]|nr:hypothetical protein DL93DRAFT_2087946 [Clavulina sp. PMI_390]
MEISDIFTKVEAFSKSLKTLKMKWITLDSASGFTAVIRAALSGKFRNLETLSVNCLFLNRVYMNPLMVNRARERTLKLYLSRLAKDGRTPNLRVIKLDNVVVEDINRLGNYVFQSAPPSLRTIEVNLAGNSYSSLYDDDPPPTYHTIEKIISDTGFPTLLHTVRQVNYKMVCTRYPMITWTRGPASHCLMPVFSSQEAVTNLATKQSIHRYSQISAVASVA